MAISFKTLLLAILAAFMFMAVSVHGQPAGAPKHAPNPPKKHSSPKPKHHGAAPHGMSPVALTIVNRHASRPQLSTRPLPKSTLLPLPRSILAKDELWRRK